MFFCIIYDRTWTKKKNVIFTQSPGENAEEISQMDQQSVYLSGPTDVGGEAGRIHRFTAPQAEDEWPPVLNIH